MMRFSSGTVDVVFDSGICHLGTNSVDSTSFADCLIWASHEVPEEFREQILEAAISLDSKLGITSILFSPELFGVVVHGIQIILLWFLLHLFFSVIPE